MSRLELEIQDFIENSSAIKKVTNASEITDEVMRIKTIVQLCDEFIVKERRVVEIAMYVGRYLYEDKTISTSDERKMELIRNFEKSIYNCEDKNKWISCIAGKITTHKYLNQFITVFNL